MLYIYRYDWHQTGTQVVIAFYAKACVPEQCLFETNQTSVSHLTSPSSLSYLLCPSPPLFSHSLKQVVSGITHVVDIFGHAPFLKIRKAYLITDRQPLASRLRPSFSSFCQNLPLTHHVFLFQCRILLSFNNGKEQQLTSLQFYGV